MVSWSSAVGSASAGMCFVSGCEKDLRCRAAGVVVAVAVDDDEEGEFGVNFVVARSSGLVMALSEWLAMTLSAMGVPWMDPRSVEGGLLPMDTVTGFASSGESTLAERSDGNCWRCWWGM